MKSQTKYKYYNDKLQQAKDEGAVHPDEDILSTFMFYKGVQAEGQRKSKVPTLTAPQAYAVSLVLASYLTEFHEDLVTMKSYSRHCWKFADPSSEDGAEYFQQLNRARTEIKKLKNRIRQIETAQKVLKSISKS